MRARRRYLLQMKRRPALIPNKEAYGRASEMARFKRAEDANDREAIKAAKKAEKEAEKTKREAKGTGKAARKEAKRKQKEVEKETRDVKKEFGR